MYLSMTKKNNSQNFSLKIKLIISIILLQIIFIVGSFSGLLYDENFYNNLYEKTGTYQRIDKEIVNEKTIELYSFFKNKAELDNKFYSENEISHMYDVKVLIKSFYRYYYASLILLLLIIIGVYIINNQNLSIFLQKLLFYSGITIMILILLFLLFNFSGLFEIFHNVFFSDNYTFPYDSNLIMMFNEQFFNFFALKIFVISGMKGFFSMLIGGYLLYFNKN